MLGFDVFVYYNDDQGKQRNLASWSSYSLDWINELVAENRAVLVINDYGYPYGYEVAAAEILPMLSPSQRDSLVQRISHWGDSSAWNGEPAWDVTINDDGLAICPEDVRLTVEAWDRS